uniref:Sulfotransferase n=1 Tax=Roseihalotalea indica TaxID=2867963 RepID=A0AA49GNK9_9BACT|nr:sulfotransferase [Tunicatimonas sp. TK19036]
MKDIKNPYTSLLPDFLIIGAGKSGTTSLEFYLKQHPGIFLPDVKEPNFFAYEMRKEEDFEDLSTKEHYRQSITTYPDYINLFKIANENQKVGEISNIYLYSPLAVERIKHHLPNVKLMAILRQPAERLFSRYTHLLRVNKTPSESFEDVFDRKSVWWKRPDLVQEGFYGKHLTKYFNSFDPSQLKIFFFEDLINAPDQLLEDMTAFIGVDNSFNFQTNTQFNKSGKVKNKWVNKLVGHESIIMMAMKKSVPQLYQGIKDNVLLKRVVENMRSSNIQTLKLSPELKQKITEEIYNDDIKVLESLIKTDLSHWR